MRTGFWDAFWAGLSCPTLLYASRHDEKYKQIGCVDAAWKQVGGYLYGGIALVVADHADQRNSAEQKK